VGRGPPLLPIAGKKREKGEKDILLKRCGIFLGDRGGEEGNPFAEFPQGRGKKPWPH